MRLVIRELSVLKGTLSLYVQGFPEDVGVARALGSSDWVCLPPPWS